jgi:hypothetical protein
MSKQALGDFFANTFGANVNRPGLNAMVAQSQQLNSLRQAQTEDTESQVPLRSAQTQQAMADAAQKQSEATAASFKLKNQQDAENALVAQGVDPAAAHARATLANAGLGAQFNDIADSEGKFQQNQNRAVLGNPNADPNARLAASTAIEGHPVSPMVALPPVATNALAPNAATTPRPVVSPLGGADIAAKEAAGALAGQKAVTQQNINNGEGGMSDDDAYTKALIYQKTGKMPTFGNGAAAMPDRRKFGSFVANLAADPNWSPDSFNTPAPGAAPGTPAKPHPTAAGVGSMVASQSDTKAGQLSLNDQVKRYNLIAGIESDASKDFDLAQSKMNATDASGSPLVNKIAQDWSNKVYTNPETSQFVNAITAARDKYARVVSSATGAAGITEGGRKEAQRLLPDTITPEAMPGLLATARAEMHNRTSSAQAQIDATRAGISGGGSAKAPDISPKVGSRAAGPPAGYVEMVDGNGNHAYVNQKTGDVQEL